MRDRPDTIKNIVAALVDGEELQDENEAGGLLRQSNDDEVEDFTDPKWEPEPVDAAPGEKLLDHANDQSSDRGRQGISFLPWLAYTRPGKRSSRNCRYCSPKDYWWSRITTRSRR